MSAPGKLNFTLYQGATFTHQLTWQTGEPLAPVDLTGCIARLQVREKVGLPTVLLELSTGNGRISPLGTDGVIALKVSATDTAAITWAKGVYDLEIEFPDGTVRRLLNGGVVVSREVTR